MINQHDKLSVGSPPSGGSPDYRNRIKGATAAEAYRHRKAGKDRAETAMVKKALRYLAPGSMILDAPCGNGRMSALLAEAGFATTGVDLSDATLENTRRELADRHLDATLSKQDLEALEFANKDFAGTLCFRFFHHLPTVEVRERVVGELCRVTRQTVLISYLNSRAPTMLKRRLRQAVGGKLSRQHGSTLMDLEALFGSHGFELKADIARNNWVHSLHLACFVSLGQQ